MIRCAAFACLLLLTQTGAHAASLTAADRDAVLAAVIAHLESDYVQAAVGKAAAEQLAADKAAGRFANLWQGETFAKVLSERLQALTDDGHLNVEFSSAALDLTKTTDESFSAEQLEQYYGAHLNFGVQTVARLAGNVGYLDLRVFAPVDMGGATVTAAMNVLANTDALIIDLRENGGGMGDMADLVASYLFDAERRPLTGTYDRPSDTLSQRFTQPYVPGQRFGIDKPAYVLISAKTFSAAEALAYNLQALDRATIVGETSGGGAHPFDYLPIHPHFVLWSVTAKSIHPITESNWQGVGILPDIPVAAADALAAALADLAPGQEASSEPP